MFVLAVMVRLRHSPDLTGVTWPTSTSISDDVAGSATEALRGSQAWNVQHQVCRFRWPRKSERCADRIYEG